MKESAKALNAVEHKSEIVTKSEGLFSPAIMAYKDAQRQTKEETKIPTRMLRAYSCRGPWRSWSVWRSYMVSFHAGALQ